MRITKLFLLLLIPFLFSFGDPTKMHCYKVVDGDTIYGFTKDGDTLKVRLWGIDCPERGQPYGDSATQFVRLLCENKDVEITQLDVDRYGRIVAVVHYELVFSRKLLSDEKYSICLAKAILSNGLGWWSAKYASSEYLYAGAEYDARKEKKGLWADPEPIAPWEWQKMSKVERDSVRALPRYQ